MRVLADPGRVSGGRSRRAQGARRRSATAVLARAERWRPSRVRRHPPLDAAREEHMMNRRNHPTYLRHHAKPARDADRRERRRADRREHARRGPRPARRCALDARRRALATPRCSSASTSRATAHVRSAARSGGTAFQLRVWRALCEIPYAATISYRELARRSAPQAVRAVGAANGAQPDVARRPVPSRDRQRRLADRLRRRPRAQTWLLDHDGQPACCAPSVRMISAHVVGDTRSRERARCANVCHSDET